MTLDEFETQLSGISREHAKETIERTKRYDQSVAALVYLAIQGDIAPDIVNALVLAKSRKVAKDIAAIQGQGVSH